jgi:hypothetical protein
MARVAKKAAEMEAGREAESREQTADSRRQTVERTMKTAEKIPVYDTT